MESHHSAIEAQSAVHDMLRDFDTASDNASGRLLLAAQVARHKAAAIDGIARLKVYTSSAVGIGEHPQLTEEMDKLVAQIGGALDALSVLARIGNAD